MKMVISFLITFGVTLIAGCTFYDSVCTGVFIAVISLFVGGKKSDNDYRADYSFPYRDLGTYSPNKDRDHRISYTNEYREERTWKEKGRGKKHKNRDAGNEARRAEAQWSQDFFNSRSYRP